MIQSRVRRVFNTTSNWLAFDQALEKNKTCWSKNQYAEEWLSKIKEQTLEKKINGSKDQLKTALEEHETTKTRETRVRETHDYRSYITQQFQAGIIQT